MLEAVLNLDTRASSKPGNVFEWRYSNRRLCDFWLLPLSSAPRMLLLWLRYSDYDDNTGALEEVDNVVDAISLTDFWLIWLLVPSMPQFQLASQLDVRGFADTVIFLAATCRALLEVSTAVAVVMSGSTKLLIAPLREEFWQYVYCLVSYYLLWWLWPNIVLDLYFYGNIYVRSPPTSL